MQRLLINFITSAFTQGSLVINKLFFFCFCPVYFCFSLNCFSTYLNSTCQLIKTLFSVIGKSNDVLMWWWCLSMYDLHNNFSKYITKNYVNRDRELIICRTQSLSSNTSNTTPTTTNQKPLAAISSELWEKVDFLCLLPQPPPAQLMIKITSFMND